MAQVADRVSRGATLAEAMRECGTYFPQLTCELTDVGELTGNLDSVLLRLSDHYQHLLRLRRTFLFGIFWPAIELVLAIFVMGLLILLLGVLGTSAAVFGLSGPRGVVIYACRGARHRRADRVGGHVACCVVGSGRSPVPC